MWIDSHCHLNHERLLHLGGAAEVIARAAGSQVDGVLNVCCRVSDEFRDILDTTRSLSNTWCTLGTHPHEAGDEAEKSFTAEQLAAIASSDSAIIAIGETGLDYYYKFSSHEDQHANFRKHLRVCMETGLPVVVHSRDAEEDTIRLISEEGQGGDLRGVMHCFSSRRILAEKALDLGFYISFSGILTFKNSIELREIARDIPLDRLLLETDAPYLAPEPLRKAINEPALMVHTGRILAEIKHVSPERIAEVTSANFFNLFNRARETVVNP